MKNFICLSLISVVLFGSCKKKEIENTSVYGLEYYPLTIGKFVVYDVDSTVYTQLPKDTVIYKYRIKEKIADEFTDNLGQKAYRLERYFKLYTSTTPYDSIPWKIKEVWMVNADNRSVQVVENNNRYTKLIFPVIENASWDGNAGNSKGERLYAYDYIDHSEQINGTALDQVLMVAQQSYSTQISYDLETERYAKNVGLVSRQITHLLSNSIIANVPVSARIESGLIYTQTLYTYGHE